MNYGRRKIYTDAAEITKDNVADEVRKAFLVHSGNRSDIFRLYNYYRGKTDILGKKKEIRPEINYKINENRAYEIVSFHRGYTFGEPIQYVRRENSLGNRDDDKLAADINALNGYMVDAGKAASDNKLAGWFYIGGTAYRMTLPNKKWTMDSDEPPFKIHILDPRQTFVVYRNTVDEEPIMAVHYVLRNNREKVFSVYTENSYYEFTEHGKVSAKTHCLGMIPIVEYPANMARLGAFEVAMPLLDALNNLQSNRMDDIVQFVNSFLAILGGELTEGVYKQIQEWKMLCLPEGTDAKYLSPTMSQNDVQTLKDDLYQSILTICCIPNRNGGSSTSDTGSAVIMRDGWQAAEASAKATELEFKESEKRFLKLVLRILRDTTSTSLRLKDIEPHFTRRNYENIASKAQVLVSMLNNAKIHPELAFAHCGMFADSESAYLQSKSWWEENEKKAVEAQNEIQDNNEKTDSDGNTVPETDTKEKEGG